MSDYINDLYLRKKFDETASRKKEHNDSFPRTTSTDARKIAKELEKESRDPIYPNQHKNK